MTSHQAIGVGTPSTPFGRGWIPAARDIGLPGEADAREDAFLSAGAGYGPCPHNAFTPARRVRFLDLLAANGNVRAACAAVGISPQGAYKARRREARFAAAWDAALVLAREHAEAVLADRALNGVEETVFFRGEEVGRRRRFDNRLLLAHLGRLDRRCEDAAAEIAVSRFDELLAVIGGLEPDEALCQAADGGEAALGLPAGREEHITWVVEEAACEDAPDNAALRNDGEEVQRWLAVQELAQVQAELDWDDWAAGARALVDAQEAELSEAGEAGGAPAEGPRSFPQDSVNCVNRPSSSLRAATWRSDPAQDRDGSAGPRDDGKDDAGTGSAVEESEFHPAASGLHEADLACGGMGEVDHAAVAEWAAIVDPDHHRLAAAGGLDAHAAAEGEGAVGSGVLGGIEALPVGRALAGELRAIPACHSAGDLFRR